MSRLADSRRLSAEQLRWTCDESAFDFDSTKSVPALKEIVGQPRAIQSLEFGLKIQNQGYNIYVSGLSGVGRMTLIKTHLEELVKFAPRPEDICFVHNFEDPDVPKALILPPGKGADLRRHVNQLVDTLREEVPRAFESKEYEGEVSAVAQASQARQQELLSGLESYASERGYTIEFTKVGITLQPVKDGEALDAEAVAKLGAAEREALDQAREEVQGEVQRFLKAAKELNKETRERIEEIKNRVGVFVVGSIVDIYKDKYGEHPAVLTYLDAFQQHAVEQLSDFGEDEERPQLPLMGVKPEPEGDKFAKYRINVVVDNSATEGAPVVIETSPSYYNLFGRIERKSYMGAMVTNFQMIKAGSILKARGGYLVVNALDVLTSPGVWESLKKVVKYEQVRIEDLGEQYSLVPLAGMKPEPIPTTLKILMIGSARIYRLLQNVDEDFRKIFKVKVDFDSRMPMDMARQDYPAFISTRVRAEGLLHFDRSGVAAVIEDAARQVDDRDYASTRFADAADLVRESSYFAHQEGAKLVSRQHVERALDEKRFRSNLIEERIQQLFAEGTVLVDLEGERVGQVNGLAVLDLGDIRFGKPSRITVKTWMGRAGVVDIEREAKLAGQIYQKGVLILSGYLGAKYAQGRPLALSASIAFEQSYDGVDGDSASSTELYALLSSLSGLPIRQGVAVTGSVNQHGEVQAIGGANEKIEGYFAVCKLKGLTGEQGVMLPASNRRHLMLSPEVRDAVEAGRFHVWSVESIDQGIEILTGVPAGEADAEGVFPEGTVHRAVQDRLDGFMEGLRSAKDDGAAPSVKSDDKNGS
ncbi:MAG: AAA family ATPase [Candidatus Krumholzibacteriia bacterium]|nr:AAA family ATPase [Candidatus Latescibacterota bacterium]MCB9515681.1 AAA family ATPase [Candidatus Latescibacterota bacterium]